MFLESIVLEMENTDKSGNVCRQIRDRIEPRADGRALIARPRDGAIDHVRNKAHA